MEKESAQESPRLWSFFDRLKKFHEKDPGEFWHSCLFWSLFVHLALYPVGYGFREVMPCLGVVFLLLYYRHSWKNSVLKKMPLLPLFACFWLMVALGVVLSTNPYSSLIQACKGLNKGYILPFIAMECVRDAKDLKRLVLACVFALFWEGLDGIWQWLTGRDFVMGYPIKAGRLTGSLASYWVGNYVALALVPATGIWFMLRKKAGFVFSGLLFLLLFAPGIFLFMKSGARAGILALLGALGFWLFLRGFKISWGSCLVFACVAGLLAFMIWFRGGLDDVISNGRWNLWSLAWAVFEEHPVFGAGIWQYNSAFRALGLVPTVDEITITHPHCIYLDLLCSHGIVGTSLGLTFLFGTLFWCARRLFPRLRALPPLLQRSDRDIYWCLSGLFFVGYVAWLFNGIVGHDFYRIWWFGLAMTYLGIAIGGVVRGMEKDSSGGRF